MNVKPQNASVRSSNLCLSRITIAYPLKPQMTVSGGGGVVWVHFSWCQARIHKRWQITFSFIFMQIVPTRLVCMKNIERIAARSFASIYEYVLLFLCGSAFSGSLKNETPHILSYQRYPY